MVEILIPHDVYLESGDDGRGETAIAAAVRKGHGEVVEVLLQAQLQCETATETAGLTGDRSTNDCDPGLCCCPRAFECG